ncbi:MAG: protein kinase [Blastococcus sp.]|nr:protein kinase [Blastococcus sp.]
MSAPLPSGDSSQIVRAFVGAVTLDEHTGTAMTEDSTGPSMEPFGSRYLLEVAIGSGAMGQVWRAATRDGEPVAIKILRPELSSDPAVVTRFLQESQILKGLNEEHLVRVHDLVVEGSRLGIVMDLIEGPDLRTEIVRRGTFRPIEAAEIVDGVLAGLAAVHAAGVVHRDIKPENVLLSAGQPGGARLTDFGVARIIEESQKARRTTVIGTPEYLAPELADGQSPTPASDFYGVGILLYELVAGVTPFTGGSPLAVLRRHADQQPVRPDGMPDGIWQTVAALLAKNPADRPSNAAQVRQQLLAAAPLLAALPALRPLTEPPAATVTSQPTVMGLRGETQALPPVVDEERRPEPRKKRTGMLVAIAALVVLLLTGGITAFALTRGDDSGGVAAAASTTDSTASSERTTSAPRTTASSTPAGGEVPAVTGLSLAQAQRDLQNAGLRVTVTEVLDDAATDNTVTAQDPAEGSRLERGSTVTLTVARRSVAVFLTSLTPVANSNYGQDTGTSALSGKTYVRALMLGTDCDRPSVIQYDLGRHYRTFATSVGLQDDSYSDGVLQLDVLIDGRSIFSGTAKLGEPLPVEVDVSGGLRLELSAARIDPGCRYDARVTAVWGDPQLKGAPGEVPPAPASPTN